MRLLISVLFATAVLRDFEVEGDADKILDVFLKAIDKLAPPDKVQEIKEKVMKMKPCLEHISQNAGDESVQKYMQSIVPMSVKCKMLTATESNEDAAHKKFRDCITKEMDKFVAPLNAKDKEAFEETRKCMREVDGENE